VVAVVTVLIRGSNRCGEFDILYDVAGPVTTPFYDHIKDITHGGSLSILT